MRYSESPKDFLSVQDKNAPGNGFSGKKGTAVFLLNRRLGSLLFFLIKYEILVEVPVVLRKLLLN